MQPKELTIRRSVSFSLNGGSAYLKPHVSMTATIDPGENLEEAHEEMSEQLERVFIMETLIGLAEIGDSLKLKRFDALADFYSKRLDDLVDDEEDDGKGTD